MQDFMAGAGGFFIGCKSPNPPAEINQRKPAIFKMPGALAFAPIICSTTGRKTRAFSGTGLAGQIAVCVRLLVATGVGACSSFGKKSG